MSLRSLDEKVIDFSRAPNNIISCIRRESEYEDDDEDNDGVCIVRLRYVSRTQGDTGNAIFTRKVALMLVLYLA